MYRGPYSLLMLLPGYDAIRVPARFAMLAALCLSVVAALAFARLTARAGPIRVALAAVVVAGVLVDSAIGEMPLQELPLRLRHARIAAAGRTAVMELPLGDTSDDVAAMYRGMYHRRPVVNGYSGFFPRSYEVLRRGLEAPRSADVRRHCRLGAGRRARRYAARPEGAWANQLAARPGTTFLGEESGGRLYSLPGGEPAAGGRPGRRLPSQSATPTSTIRSACRSRSTAIPTRDGTAGRRRAPRSSRSISAPSTTVDGVTMTIGAHRSDFPRHLVIESSEDARDWTTRWQGSAAVAAFAGAVRHPGDMPLTFALPHVPARWLRLRQLGPRSGVLLVDLRAERLRPLRRRATGHAAMAGSPIANAATPLKRRRSRLDSGL